jgi:xylan 1,4-beta-xylosidase
MVFFKETIAHMNSGKKHLCMILAILMAMISAGIAAQEVPDTFTNPILPGFHPDPSICRVGEDYYLVNSSFEWYPGLPVYHSRDLVNWELIGYGMHRPMQVELPVGLHNSGGVYAPTIRFHDGIFYIINTCVGCGGNFYITATDPAGPWSDPVWLPDAPGIDPHLFWDDDGRCYYVGNGRLMERQQWPSQQGAWMQELDLETGNLIGAKKQLSYGHASNAVWGEGPHLYRIDGTYMLLLAEGGTDFNHSVTIHTSKSLWGPYIPIQANPVLTHRHLGEDYPVWATGHADLVQTQKGEWWSVMLAKRRTGGFTLLGRETFLAKVDLEKHNGELTPVYNKGEGRLLMEQARPDLPWTPVKPLPVRDEFDSELLDLHWNFLRTPYQQWWALRDGRLELWLRPEVADSLVNPSLVARRIEDHDFNASLKLSFATRNEYEQAGLILYRTSRNHFLLLKGKDSLVLSIVRDGHNQEIARVPWKDSEVILGLEARGVDVAFRYGPTEDRMEQIGPVQSMALLSDEQAWGFNGPYVGMYATSNGLGTRALAAFDWFGYQGLDRVPTP